VFHKHGVDRIVYRFILLLSGLLSQTPSPKAKLTSALSALI